MQNIKATDAKYGTVQTEQEMHFTNGVRALRSGEGWAIGPFLNNKEIAYYGPIQNIKQFSNEIGVILLGINQIVHHDYLTSNIWEPILGTQSGNLSAADAWGAVSAQARLSNDDEYADLAQYLSISLRAADFRLMNASNEYHRQLCAALKRGFSVNKRFTNLALSELHLAFHSLLAELGAARDYLAAIVALHVEAPKSIDSLARLMTWLDKSANSKLLNEPLIAPLTSGWNEESLDRWLFDFGTYRNTFLHKEPFGGKAMDRSVVVRMVESHVGPIHTLNLDIPYREDSGEMVDALGRFVYFYKNFQKLGQDYILLAKYKPIPPTFVIQSK